MTSVARTYLGDGLCAKYDGFQFTLIAPRGDEDHFVMLEPQVLAAFLAYAGEQLGRRITFAKDAPCTDSP